MFFDDAERLVKQGDAARDAGRLGEAVSHYDAARSAYLGLKAAYPKEVPGIVEARRMYCEEQIRTLAHADAPDPAGDEGPDRGLERVPQGEWSLPQLKERARVSIRQRKIEEARQILLQALLESPDDVTVRELIAMVHCMAGEYEQALYLTEELVREVPDRAMPHLILGGIHLGMGNLAPAEKEVACAVDLDPNLVQAHYNLAQLLALKNPPEPEKAQQHYARSLELGGQKDPNLEEKLKGGDPKPPDAAVP
jgi:tetratricopeptide (TPR) repeat protein